MGHIEHMLFTSLPTLTQSAATILVATLWQGALLAAFVWICLKLAPRTTAALRFSIWSASFGVVVILPLLHLHRTSVSGVSPSGTAIANHPWFQLDARWSLLITALWAAASLYRAVDLTSHSIRLRRLWTNATPVPTSASQLSAIRQSKIGRQAQLCTTSDLDRPSVIGFFKPRILIPEWLFANLSQSELEQILLHEHQHLGRGDDWTNLLQKISLILFPVNPALLWIERRLCFEREMACDEGVIQITHAPRAYATCLTRLAEHRLQRHSEVLSLGTWHRRSELVHRVHSILASKQFLGPVAARALSITLIAGLAIGSLELSRCPQLIAFVPVANVHQRSIAQTFGNTPNPEAFHTVSARNSARPHLVELTATMPPRDTNSVINPRALRTTPRPFDAKQIIQKRAQLNIGIQQRSTQAHALTQPQAPTPNSLVAETNFPALPTDTTFAINETYSVQQESLVVFATWQEYTTHIPSSQTAHPSSRTGTQPIPKPVVFQVGPPNSSSPTFAAVPFRSGWLVIQL
ncbi:M56 family metallopeptidase [Acidicapsa ligni]|uniref:M56 family metallopeptidase n=1 Tax=Acidicapsa ligni TaxID=542300 RepID=UPI0021E0DC81|nr:M56 family metallopeptidase [Acidicapsa ligni]